MSMDGAQPKRLGTGDCERLRDGWASQPVNTASNAAYIAVGAAFAGRALVPGSPRAGERLAYGGLMVLVGLGSIAYHGPQPRGAEMMHDAPIAVASVMSAVTPLVRLARHRTPLPGWTARRGLLAVGLTTAALAAYAAGRTDAPTCNPDSLLQWHGVWHVLSAAAYGAVGEILY